MLEDFDNCLYLVRKDGEPWRLMIVDKRGRRSEGSSPGSRVQNLIRVTARCQDPSDVISPGSAFRLPQVRYLEYNNTSERGNVS